MCAVYLQEPHQVHRVKTREECPGASGLDTIYSLLQETHDWIRCRPHLLESCVQMLLCLQIAKLELSQFKSSAGPRVYQGLGFMAQEAQVCRRSSHEILCGRWYRRQGRRCSNQLVHTDKEMVRWEGARIYVAANQMWKHWGPGGLVLRTCLFRFLTWRMTKQKPQRRFECSR